MAKKSEPLLSMTLPSYPLPKQEPILAPRQKVLDWRRKMNRLARKTAKEEGVKFAPDDAFDIEVRIGLTQRQIERQDVDNLVKHIFDALQGRAGGPKNVRRKGVTPLIPNDHQIFRLTVEKSRALSDDEVGEVHLIIRKHTQRARRVRS